jgi:hypothetical protein
LEIFLNGNEFGAQGLKCISRAIETNSALYKISMAFNNIGDEGAKWFSEAIKWNYNLQVINLRGNRIKDEGAKWISKAIEHNSALLEIDLSWNLIEFEGSKCLSKAIRQNSTLQKINLEGNLVRANGAKYLAEAIKQNSSLLEINLEMNFIRNEGVKYLAQAIKHNSSLLEINLERNHICDEGARYIARAVISTLEIKLSWDDIRDGIAQWIVEAIEQNSSYFPFIARMLEYVSPFGKRAYNSTFDVIHLSNNYISYHLESHIANILQERRVRKERNYRRYICAFIDDQKGKRLIRLPFDKMILRFVCYPIMEFATND